MENFLSGNKPENLPNLEEEKIRHKWHLECQVDVVKERLFHDYNIVGRMSKIQSEEAF